MKILSKSIKNVLKKSDFKDVAVLSLGVLAGQIINIISMPIVTRLYSVESFGILSTIVSLVSILTPLITLQYHMNIVNVKSDKEANVLSALSFYLIIILSLIFTFGFIFFKIIHSESFTEVGNWIYCVIPLLFFNGIINVVDSYNNRFGQYKLMASVYFQRAVASNFVKILLGIFNLGVLGLLISQIVSIVFGVKKQSEYILTKYKEIFSVSFIDLKSLALKYKAQPLFSMPGLFVTSFSFSILPILIVSQYSVEEAGYFSLTMTVLGVPLTLMSSNIARVFFRNASKEYNKKGNFFITFKNTSIMLSLMSISVFLFLWFIAEPLFTIVFGENWSKSGLYVKILIPMFAIRFVVMALMHGFIVSGNQLFKLILQSFFIIFAFVAYGISHVMNLSIETFLKLINYTYFINYIILFITLYFISKKNRLN